MWKSAVELIDKGRVRKTTLLRDDKRLSFTDVISGWRDSHAFRDFYISLLADAPFKAMFWESPAVTRSSVNQLYEFVLVDSTELAHAEAEPASFARRFDSAVSDETVVTFENLGKDAHLVVPCPRAPLHIYTHLATFLRGAPEPQRHELFITLAREISKNLSDKPLWVSTSGLGVFWIHLRLDSWPKYYNFLPYRNM